MVERQRRAGTVGVVHADQLDGGGPEPLSSHTSRTTVSAGVWPTSAQPPGMHEPPSARSWTSRMRPSRTTAPRTSTFGVA